MLTRSVWGAGRLVALTFDDGPNSVDTPVLLEVLRRHEVPATFFLWGDHVVAHPELVRAIVAGGHRLGNHTMHHHDLSSWTPTQVEADLRETNAAIGAAAPGAPVEFYRAPFGRWGVSAAVAVTLGMRPVEWRLAVIDWEPPGADELLRRLRVGITPGAVILLHDGPAGREQTVEAVDRLIPRLKRDGWRFATPPPPAPTAD